MQHGALIHKPDDDVAVVVKDTATGAEVKVVTLEGQEVGTVKAVKDVPLGHKIAMRDIPEGDKVIEYGRPIGKATQAIPKGAHVHIHNIRSLRWGS
ncbi:MAG TPA: hypothetical protein EYP04_09970 [Anaerolineae bacterium]|nr:hypothetical protein [Anaerolineae bacterium]HIQ06230.1 hypothetical protein [Anaerolineae bacterium]